MKLGRPAIIALVTACGAMSPTAMQIIVPVLPYIRADFHTSIAATQWLVSIFSAALAVALLTCGPLSDRWGRRRLLVAGMVVFTLGSALAWYATSLAVLILARVVQAIGAGAASSISRAAAADLFAGEDLTHVLAYTTMGLVIGPLVAPTIAGILADRAGWASVMLLLFILGAVVTVATVLGMPETRPAGSGSDATNPVRDWGRMVADPSIRIYMSVLVATQVGVYAFISVSPYLIVEVLHRSATEYGLFFIWITLGYLGGNIAAVRLARRMNSARAVLVGLVTFILAWVLLAGFVVTGHWNTVTLFGPAALMTFANGLIQPNCHAAAISLAGDRRGTAASLTGFAQIMAGAVGLQIMAFVHGAEGSPLPMVLVIGVATFACVLLALTLGRQERFPATR